MAPTPADQAQVIEDDFGRLLKQLVAHIAAWDPPVRIALDEVVDGRPAPYANWDEDAYNRSVVQLGESPMMPASGLTYTYKCQTHYAGHAMELEGLDPGAST